MGLTKRKESYYVEFQVLDDGKTLTLAPSVSGGETEAVEGRRLNRTLAKQQEAFILLRRILRSLLRGASLKLS